MTIELVIFGSVILGVLGGLFLERMRPRLDGLSMPSGSNLRLAGPGRTTGLALAAPRQDSAGQLRVVADARFAPKPLMSDNGARLLDDVETIIADLGTEWRVMAQVSLAEIVASSDAAAVSALDAHYVDLLIVAADRMPVAVVEYQALGQVRDDDAVRAAVKREALRRAGIVYFEVRSQDVPGELRDHLAAVAARYATDAPVRARKPRGKPASGVNP